MTSPDIASPPRSPWESRIARIVAIRAEAPEVRGYDLAFRDPGPAYDFLPGQFNMLLLPGIGEAAISVSSDPAAPATVGHTVRAVGNVTQALARCEVGAEVVLRGPFGRPWPLAELRGRHLVIAAGGVGLASLRSAICQLIADRDAYGSIAILHGARTPADLLYSADHAAWRAAGLDLLTIVESADAGWTGPTGLVPDLFANLDLAPGATSLLCCGPERMMAAVAARATADGIGPPDTFLSLERNMACAAGFCGLCQFGPTFVCRDGPVFRADAIAPFLAVEHL